VDVGAEGQFESAFGPRRRCGAPANSAPGTRAFVSKVRFVGLDAPPKQWPSSRRTDQCAS
jgi:hypothetical protein